MLSFVEHGRHSIKCGQARVWLESYGGGVFCVFLGEGLHHPVPSMGLVYLPTFIVNVYGKCR